MPKFGSNTRVLSGLIKTIKAQTTTMKNAIPKKKQAPKSQANTKRSDGIKQGHRCQFGYKEYIIPHNTDKVKAKKQASKDQEIFKETFFILKGDEPPKFYAKWRLKINECIIKSKKPDKWKDHAAFWDQILTITAKAARGAVRKVLDLFHPETNTITVELLDRLKSIRVKKRILKEYKGKDDAEKKANLKAFL